MKNKASQILLKASFIILAVVFVNTLIAKVDKAIFIVIFILVITNKGFEKKTRSLLILSLILIFVSVLLFIINSPNGNLTYYVEKISLWSFYSFVVAIVNIGIAETITYLKKN